MLSLGTRLSSGIYNHELAPQAPHTMHGEKYPPPGFQCLSQASLKSPAVCTLSWDVEDQHSNSTSESEEGLEPGSPTCYLSTLNLKGILGYLSINLCCWSRSILYKILGYLLEWGLVFQVGTLSYSHSHIVVPYGLGIYESIKLFLWHPPPLPSQQLFCAEPNLGSSLRPH